MSALNELYDELEHTFRDNSEVLITSLALRDELEYEKELKNQFISLLLEVQKKRQMNKKRYASNKKQKSAAGAEPGTVSGVHVVQPSTFCGSFKPPESVHLMELCSSSPSRHAEFNKIAIPRK